MTVAGLLCCTEVYIHAAQVTCFEGTAMCPQAALCAIECFGTAMETAQQAGVCQQTVVLLVQCTLH
jgi:hypothetical protein